jgi:hypothetical protein
MGIISASLNGKSKYQINYFIFRARAANRQSKREISSFYREKGKYMKPFSLIKWLTADQAKYTQCKKEKTLFDG